MICQEFEQPVYFFFSSDVPSFLYYSHIPVTVLTILVGLFVFLHNPKSLLNRLLLLISMCFLGLTLINLVLWTNINSGVILFAWSLFGTMQALIAVLSIYFIYVFIYKTDISGYVALMFFILLLPALLLGATNLNLSGIDLVLCDAFAYEGEIYNQYYTLLTAVAMAWIAVLLFRNYPKADITTRRQILLMGIGIEAFLFIFFTIFYIADYLATIRFVQDSSLEFLGFLGMGIFVVLMGVLIVKFRTFNVGAQAAEALTIALLILIGSQYTYIDTTTGLILTTVTLVLTGVACLFLIRSVRKEIEQRKMLEDLTKKLEKANKRLKVLDQMKSEFVSIASHQLRSPLTAIRGYASMLMEGSYGPLSQKAQEAVGRINESSGMMATSIEDYLNVSRIQAGNMKYEYSDFNLPDTASKLVDDKRSEAMRKGLVLSFKSDMNKQGIVNADKGKTMQIIHNLINNSVKYTQKGTITVFVHDKGKEIYLDVIDTGIGMSKETIEGLFGKFERAKNANEINVTGTGLGLYVAQKMAQEMGGGVTAFSDGEGKGSTFRLTLPLQM